MKCSTNNSNIWLRGILKIQGSATEPKWVTSFNSSHIEKSAIVTQLLVISTVIALLLRKYYANRKPPRKNREDCKGTRRNIPKVKSICPLIDIPIIDSLYNVYQVGKYGVKFFERRMQEYGHFYEMPFGLSSAYFISDPNMIQKHLTSTNPNHQNKPKEFREIFLKDFMEDVLFAADVDVCSPHRKILSRSFTHKSIQSCLGIMNRNAKRMSQEMIQAAASSKGNIEGERLAELQFNTVKIIAEIILGTDVMTDEELNIFLNTYKTGKDIFLERLLNPLLMIKAVWWFHPKKKQVDDGIIFVRQFVLNIINKYRTKRELRGGEQKLDDGSESEIGIKPFRSMLEEMLLGGMRDKQIIDEVLGMLLAGHETTSVAINTLMFHLALHPEYQQMCREEVDELLALKNAGLEDDYELSMEDCSSLKFLERCILENLRLTPTLPIFMRRLDDPLKIDDEFELEGNGKHVIILPWCLHRNPEYYPNPEKFEPDRFLPQNVKKRPSHTYLPFSVGPRMCIGWKMSIIEMKIVMFWILRNFEIYTTDKMEDITFRVDITL